MATEFCPRCGNPRTGSFDFDETAAQTPAPPQIDSPPVSQAGHSPTTAARPSPTGWAAAPAPTVRPPIAKPGALRRFLVFLAIVVVIGVGASVLRPKGSASTFVPAEVTPAGIYSWTPPSGFSRTDVEGVAYRWDTSPECVLDTCWGMEIVTRDGCPSSLYVAVTTLTDSGTVVGYSNDSVTGLRAGESARLVFENTDPTATKARIAEVVCR